MGKLTEGPTSVLIHTIAWNSLSRTVKTPFFGQNKKNLCVLEARVRRQPSASLLPPWVAWPSGEPITCAWRVVRPPPHDRIFGGLLVAVAVQRGLVATQIGLPCEQHQFFWPHRIDPPLPIAANGFRNNEPCLVPAWGAGQVG